MKDNCYIYYKFPYIHREGGGKNNLPENYEIKISNKIISFHHLLFAFFWGEFFRISDLSGKNSLCDCASLWKNIYFRFYAKKI